MTSSSIATAVEAIRLGAMNYLPKPADADDILAALHRDGANLKTTNFAGSERNESEEGEAEVQTFERITHEYPSEGTTATVVVKAPAADRAEVRQALRRLDRTATGTAAGSGGWISISRLTWCSL